MRNVRILFVVTMNLKYYVCYNRKTLLGKHAKPNQPTQYVHFNCVFVITVIVITVIVITVIVITVIVITEYCTVTPKHTLKNSLSQL